MAYCAVTDIRNLTDLSSTDLNDSQVTNIIAFATYELNSDIGVIRKIPFDSNNFVGDFDNANTVFTFINVPIGDLDNDGSVGITDIEVWSKLNIEDHWTSCSGSISTIDDHVMGKFTFVTAPQTNTDYIIKYRLFPLPYNSNLIKMALAEFSAFLC